jgi:mannose-6-phosphate isomerase-like protein (cupin superfamily)
MIVVRAADVEGYTTPLPHQRLLKLLLSPRLQPQVSGLAVGMAIVDPGQSTDGHAHPTEQEMIFCVSGRGEITIGSEKVAMQPDTLVLIPPGTPHQAVNTGSEPLKALWVFVPDGPEENLAKRV